MDWQAVGVTVRLASYTTFILLIVGLPLSYGLTRWKSPCRPLIEALIALPLVLPPTVLGFYLLLAMGPQSWVGNFLEKSTGLVLPFSFSGLLIGSVIYSLPFAVQPFLAAFQSVDPAKIEASWCMGISKTRTFFKLILPLSASGILTGTILSFAHTLGEFGVVLMIGGDIPGATRTLSVSLYDQVQSMDYKNAASTSLLLLAVSLFILTLLGHLRKSQAIFWITKNY